MTRSIACACGASISLNSEPIHCPTCRREVAEKDHGGADRESGPALQGKYRRHLPIASILVAPILLAILLPMAWITHERAQEPVVQMRSQENLRQIARAMIKYNDNNGRLPPAVIFDKDGQPLHSWRVLLLPYLGKKPLYDQFRLDEPWDSAHNRPLLAQIPDVYAPFRPHATTNPHSTFYQVFDGPDGQFCSGVEKRRLRPSTENLQPFALPGWPAVFEAESMPRFFRSASTFLIVEAGEAVPWTKPMDLFYQWWRPLPELGGMLGGDFNAAFADGSVRCIRRHKVKEETIRQALIQDWGDWNL